MDTNNNKSRVPKPLTYWYLILLAGMLGFYLLFGQSILSGNIEEVSYSQFTKMIESGAVQKVRAESNQYRFEAKNAAGQIQQYKTGPWADYETLTKLLRAR